MMFNLIVCDVVIVDMAGVEVVLLLFMLFPSCWCWCCIGGCCDAVEYFLPVLFLFMTAAFIIPRGGLPPALAGVNPLLAELLDLEVT